MPLVAFALFLWDKKVSWLNQAEKDLPDDL